jgi:succinate dehydrogenase/fumarate reductase flavoprotein subunit
VIVLEKMDYVGGNSVLAGGHAILGGGTHVQVRNGIKDSAEWWYEDQMEFGDNRAVPEIVSTYTKKGPELALWMEQLGLAWSNTVLTNPDGRVPRGHWPAPSPNYAGGYPAYAGLSEITVLQRAAEKRGVSILLKHKVERIHRMTDGPVLGVEVDTEQGTINIRASKAVVLASGGWKCNPQMRMAWDPRLDTDLYWSGYPYVQTTGEVTMAAMDIGAGVTDMSFVCHFSNKWGTRIHNLWEPPALSTVVGVAGLPLSDYKRIIAVKNDGARFVNEAAQERKGEGPTPFDEAWFNLKERPRNVWAVTDADGAAALKWPEAAMRNPQPKVLPCLQPDYVAVADNIAQLAGKMGIDAAGLAATVSKYNGFVAAGVDQDFKKPGPLYPILKPPFFAAKRRMGAHDQMSGLRANTRAQVLDRSDQVSAQGVRIDQEKVIPRLYAAGECVGGYFGTNRGSGKLGVYMIWGRIAGQNSAREMRLS